MHVKMSDFMLPAERIPGAWAIAAKTLGVEPEELRALIIAGEVDGENFRQRLAETEDGCRFLAEMKRAEIHADAMLMIRPAPSESCSEPS